MYLIKLKTAVQECNWFPIIHHSELENDQEQNNLYS